MEREENLSAEDRYQIKPDQGIEMEDTLSEDERITAPYDPSEIQVDPKQMTIFQVMRKIGLEEINMQPDFQRKLVWNVIRQSRLIESILIGIPLPAFYLDAVKDDDWLIVDGLQRLSTMYKFIDKKELILKGLEFLTHLEGKTFDQLPREFQRRIEEATLYLYIIKPNTPPEVKFTIFYRINTGGMVLSAQEIRHCLFQGKAAILLKKLAETKEFLDATTGSINTKRMDDRECVLRYCAFHLQSYKKYNTQDLNLFLGNTMQLINEMNGDDIEKLRRDFIEAMKISEKVFGKYAFRKIYDNLYRNPINKALFETWSVCLGDSDQKEKIIDRKEKIVRYFKDSLNYTLATYDSDYEKSISVATGGVKSVHKRFETTLYIIKEALK